MDGIEAPSFELGLDLQLDSESLYQDLNSPMRETFLTPEDSEGFQLRVSESDVDALDDPVPTLRRLRRGPSSRSKSVSDQLSEQSPINADDDIEEFSSQDYARSEDEHLSVQQHSVCSSSKLSLIESGVLTRQAATETPCRKRNQTLNTPASLDASKDPMTFSTSTGSCFQRFQLLDSDSDDSPDCVCIDRDGARIPFSKHTEANHGSFVPACVERSEPSVSKQRVMSKYFYPKKTSHVPTPAFDEFCEEYFGAAKDTKAAYDSVHGLCLAKLEGISGGSKKMDHKDSCRALPPALSYFFHENTRIQRLVRSRLPHFWPLASVDDTGFNQPNESVIDYMTQFSNGDCPRQGGGAKVIVEKRPRRVRKGPKPLKVEETSCASRDWVNPKKYANTTKDAGRRRVHADGRPSGHWYTAENGKKVYVTINGQELSGRTAYRQYRKESGARFTKLKKKSAAKRK